MELFTSITDEYCQMCYQYNMLTIDKANGMVIGEITTHNNENMGANLKPIFWKEFGLFNRLVKLEVIE